MYLENDTVSSPCNIQDKLKRQRQQLLGGSDTQVSSKYKWQWKHKYTIQMAEAELRENRVCNVHTLGNVHCVYTGQCAYTGQWAYG